MSVTLKDIAKESGFSITTVSRALAGYDDVSQNTREQIIKIANDLGYQPNQIARQLQGQRTNTIGLIMPPRPATDDDDFFSLLLKGITYEAARCNYDVLVSASQLGRSEIDTYRRIVGGNRVDGVILARIYQNDKRIAYLQKQKHPFVVLGRNTSEQNTNFSYLDVDTVSAFKTLVTHLVERGHRDIGIILPPETVTTTFHRLQGYKLGLEEAGIAFDENHCIHSDYTFNGGKDSAEVLLKRASNLTAIIGCNDWMALGAIATLQSQNIEVGQKFSVVGYDNIPAAARSIPSLTTIHTPIYELGERITRLLMRLIDDKSLIEQEIITPKLIIRESSGLN